MTVNLSTNSKLFALVIFIFFSNHLLFFFMNCFIGKASKNSLAKNMLGPFSNLFKESTQETLQDVNFFFEFFSKIGFFLK
jgi:hypothetical protein